MNQCPICAHPQRYQLEQAVLNLSSDNKVVTLKTIAEEYEVPLNDLKVHMITHSSLYRDEEPEKGVSLARKIKLREADMLALVASEQLATMQNLGRRINRNINDDNVLVEKLLTKPVVELYLGTSSEVRATIRDIAELDKLLNGPKSDEACGITGLISAIKGSSAQTAKGELS